MPRGTATKSTTSSKSTSSQPAKKDDKKDSKKDDKTKKNDKNAIVQKRARLSPMLSGFGGGSLLAGLLGAGYYALSYLRKRFRR